MSLIILIFFFITFRVSYVERKILSSLAQNFRNNTLKQTSSRDSTFPKSEYRHTSRPLINHFIDIWKMTRISWLKFVIFVLARCFVSFIMQCFNLPSFVLIALTMNLVCDKCIEEDWCSYDFCESPSDDAEYCGVMMYILWIVTWYELNI